VTVASDDKTCSVTDSNVGPRHFSDVESPEGPCKASFLSVKLGAIDEAHETRDVLMIAARPWSWLLVSAREPP